jgi:multidrug transporter EmrE-like cation transporter
MLRELARLSGGMLFMGGHVTDAATLRLLARDEPSSPTHHPHRGRRAPIGGPSSRDWRTPIELLLLAAIWGGSFLFLRIAAPKFGATSLVEVRLALGALVLSPFLWRARRQLAAAGWFKIAAIGLVNTLLPFLLFAWGAERAPAGISAIVNSMAVPFAALAAFALFGERIGARRLTGLVAGLVGVVVLASGDADAAGVGAAVAAGTAAAFLYGVSAIWSSIISPVCRPLRSPQPHWHGARCCWRRSRRGNGQPRTFPRRRGSAFSHWAWSAPGRHTRFTTA